jgi:hypothetical protein
MVRRLLCAWVAFMAMVLPSASPALGQADPRACVAVAGNQARLACFDAAFASGSGVEAAMEAFIDSSQLIPARPVGRERAQMRIACQTGVLSVSFRFAGQLVSATGDFGAITFLTDAQSARTRTLSVSADNQALGFWTSAEATAFLDALDGVQNLSVRITPLNQRSLNVRFDLSGLAAAAAPVRQACEAKP